MQKRRWAIVILVCVLCISLDLPQNAWGADNYTHDADISRDNTIRDTGYNGLVYNRAPYYVELKWNGIRQQSNTTPVVVGSELFQYTYDANNDGIGHLWQIDLQKPQSGWPNLANEKYGAAISLNATPILTFDEGFSGANGDINNAAGISGPTITKDYSAIAVGNYLYWWPTGHPDQDQYTPIGGNPGNTIQEIAASPLITPPLMASGIDQSSGQTVNWQTPFAVVGSWSGGVISQAMYTPSNVLSIPNYYKTTNDASNATNDIVTSSPAWNPNTTAVGTQGAAIFGVDAAQSGKNRLILMDPVTGNYKTVYQSGGSPIFYGPIDSSPAIAPDGTIFVPDQGAAVYELSYDGSYIADDTTAMDQSNPCIANIALDGQNVIWVGNGHTTLNESPIAGFGQGSTQIGGFNGLDSPAVVNNGSTDTVFLASTSMDGLLVTNPLGYNSLSVSFDQDKFTWKEAWQTLGSVTPAYTSVAADVGTDPTDGSQLHYVATWTDIGYQTPGVDNTPQGCVEIWTPAPYSVTAQASPNVVDEGNTVLITATPYPSGITKSVTAHITDGGSNTWDLTLNKWPNDQWSWQTLAPNNYSGQPATYTVTVTATSLSGQTVQATTTFIVNPGPWVPKGNIPATLQINAYGLPDHTQQLPYGIAKYGDYLDATLTVSPPAPPSGYLDAMITGISITKASVHHEDGAPNVGCNLQAGDPKIKITYQDTDMLLNGSTATCEFRESWAGYPPPIPDNTVMETDWLYAQFNVHVTFIYLNGYGYWQTGSYDASGTVDASLEITGTEYYTFVKSDIQYGDPE